ncbi:TPT1 [Candida oxycetoniae]|uniref:2'-phosphotransferase n=1 Tax=Candida oxycetoniae TaxID=497107 RepID=A0AAI9WW59_9ASCO|nr:TPT1 [Candida oxycetoniae]KAI3402603.1 TPT1 [Candida oxycetoniae]
MSAKAAYKNALRSINVVFKNDIIVKQEAKLRIKNGILEKANLTKENEISQAVDELNQVGNFLLKNVVQGQLQPNGKYLLNFHDKTELGDNESIKQEKNEIGSLSGLKSKSIRICRVVMTPGSDQASRRDILISKTLSYLLRHGALKEKLDINAQGYISIPQLLQHQRLKSFKTTREDLERVVKENNKQRFHINLEKDAICANQGHSIPQVSGELEPMNKEELSRLQIFHGTYKKKLPMIKRAGGLSKMNRNHIHLTCEKFQSLSGIRKTANCLIYINTDKCIDEKGLKFWKSANNVILCCGNKDGLIELDCIDKIVDLTSGTSGTIDTIDTINTIERSEIVERD